MDRNALLSTAGETIAYAEDYLNTRIELVKLDVAQKGSNIVANAIAGAIVAVFGIFALGCLTVSLAIWIGHLLNRPALGFLLVALLYLLVAGALFVARKALLTNPLLETLIGKLFATDTTKGSNHGERS